MICPYCGFEYADDLLRCPHCGAENVREAREQQQETLDSLEEEREDIRHEPERILKKTNRAAARIGVRIFIGVVIAALLIVAGSFIWRFWTRHTLTRNVERLDACLAEGDYEGLSALLDRIDSYDSAYDPYYPVLYAYQDLSYVQDDLEWFRTDLESGLEDTYLLQSLSFALNDAMNALIRAESGLQDDLYLGNEDALQDIYGRARELLTGTLKVTEEEIGQMAELYEDQDSLYDESLFLPYATLILERLE